jgi:hypothetical protein
MHLLVPPSPKDWSDRNLKSWKNRMMELPVELLSSEEGDDIGWS